IKSLKKKSTKLRTIPLSDRLYRMLGEYFNKTAKLNIEADNYIFPSYAQKGHIDRRTIWKILKRHALKLNIPNVHPHTLRHSFATHHLSQGTSLAEIKEMLGHSKFDTTLIYAEIPTEKLKQQVNAVTTPPLTIWQKIYGRISPKKPTKLINLDFTESYFTIGRNQQLKQLENNANKGINTILIGSIGVGKSHLLENLKTNRKILRLDDSESIKQSLVQILLYLYKDKDTVNAILWKDFTIEEIKKKIQRQNISHLCSTITASVEPKEYVLLIDDSTRITPTGKKALENLKDTFTIITSARQIKANDTSFIWDFEVIKLKPLARHQSIQLIHQLSNGLNVENWELFHNHIYEQSNGNPRAITELVNRYKKEPVLTDQIIREIKHTGALVEFDMTFIIVLFLGAVTAMRYMSRELDAPALRFIGSIGLILLIVSRPLFKNLKRKFI
ncbi:MAG: tyrosine-type recombinase/integrase, partial [Flavobacteriaceae bacterium]